MNNSYNYYYEVATIIITSILFIDIFSKRQFYRKDSKLFAIAIIFQILISAVDIASCICLSLGMADPTGFPRWVNLLLLIFYFCFKPVLMFFLTTAILAYPENSLKNVKKYVVLAIVVCGSNFIISFLTAWIPIYYILDENQVYSFPPLHNLLYYYHIFETLVPLAFCIIHHKKFLLREKFALIAAGFFMIATVEIQRFIPGLLITGLGVAMSMLLIYVVLENPNGFLDRRTGCNNSEALRVFMNDWSEKTDRYAFAVVRIHRFKLIEASYGFKAAEEIVRKFSDFLRYGLKSARNTFRLDEDTFVIVVKGGENHIKFYEQKISEKFAEMWMLLDGTILQLERVMGVCQYPTHFSDYNSFLEMNEYLMEKLSAMYAGGVLYADQTILKSKMHTIEVEDALRRALAEDSIQVYYQPIYDIIERKVIGLEALCRLQDKRLGSIPPDVFIKVAEDSGLIFALGELIFKKVCRFIHRRLLKVSNCTIKTVEVNLSPVQLMHRDTIFTFKQIMTDYKIPRGIINFEITESATADSPAMVTNAMKELMDFGCDFSLDDYGTGYSNISYMLKFSFVRIKFDKELIWSYFGDKSANIILRHEFEIIKSLGKEIIAEGVEEERYIEELSRYGVRYFQGFFFSKALPPDEIIAYLESPTPESMFPF